MPIPVTCPECDSSFRVADDAAGKAIKCKQCGARVSVPAGADHLSALNTGSPGDGEAGGAGGVAKAKKKGGSGKLIAIIAGVVVLLGCCCILPPGIGGLGWYLGWFGRPGGPGGNVILDKTDTLTQLSPKAKNGKTALPYKVKLEARTQSTIDMKADHPAIKVQDPFLMLEDSKGAVVAQDDDSGGNFNAQIRFTPIATGEYTIQASTFGTVPPGGMPFRLTVRRQ